VHNLPDLPTVSSSHRVERAFGDFPSWLNSFNNLMSSVADNALYPVIMASYFPWTLTYWQKWAFMAGATLIALYLNYRGLELVGSVSTLLTIFILLPVVLLFCWDARKIDPAQQWTVKPDRMDWGAFLGVTLWIYSGWDSVGTIAGEVENVERTYPIAVLLCLGMQATAYIMPVIWGLTFNGAADDWVNGYFGTLGHRVDPPVGYIMDVSAMVGNFGVYMAEITCTSRVMWAMGTDSMGKQLLSQFGYLSPTHHTPVVALLVQTVITW